MLGLFLLAFIMRLWGIALPGIDHPEIYVPGIPLPEGISEPPPRHDFGFALWWHFHDEPHPMGWYLAMMGWTELFGVSHTALRLPSAIFGAAAVCLVALIGRKVWNAPAGLVAAAMLALHGFHIYWSQNARMYTAGVFLGLLSTWLLLRLVASGKPRPWLETAYVLTAIAGIQTVELFWPVLALQVAWVALVSPGIRWRGWGAALRLSYTGTPRLLQVQTLALMLALPGFAHSLYRARAGAASEPEALFLADYAGFGFLFSPDQYAVPELSIPTAAMLAIAALALGLTVAGLSARARPLTPAGPAARDLPRWLPLAVAIATAALLVWLGFIAHWRRLPMAALSGLAFMALAIPVLAGAVRSLLAAASPAFDRWRAQIAPAPLLFALYAFLAPLVLFAVSFKISVLAPRAFTVFLPYLLLLAAAGVPALLRRRRAAGLAVGATLIPLFVLSIPYAWQKPASARDYLGLATGMAERMEPGDLVFMRNRNWADTPLYYYLPDARYVVRDWAAAAAAEPQARVWVVTWPPLEAGPRGEALAGYERLARIDKLRARAELFARAPQ